MAAVAATAALAWPVSSHLAVLTGHPQWMPGITAGVALVLLATTFVTTSSALARTLLGIGMLAIVAAWHRWPALLLFVPPAAINVALGIFFVTTLRRGHEPRIARFARLERGIEVLPADLALYARRLTWVWSGYFFAAAAVGLLLAAFAPLAVWSAFTNVLSYLLVALLFVGEHAFRTRRFAHYRHASLTSLLRTVVRDRPTRPGSGE